jgi:hypothetical protein
LSTCWPHHHPLLFVRAERHHIGGKRTLFGKETLNFGGTVGELSRRKKGARYKIGELKGEFHTEVIG